MKLRTALVAIAGLLFVSSAHAQALVGLWQFEDNFDDSSSFANNGAELGGVTFVAGQAGYGQAADFSGNDTRVVVPHAASLNMTTAMTMSAWVNADGNSFEGILAKNPSNGSGNNHAGNYEFRLENGSLPIVALYQRGGANDTAGVNGGASTNVPAGEWHHVAVTIDGSGPTETINFYLDGMLQNTLNGANGFGATNTNPLYIGNRADLFTDFHGQLDDVALFDGVLTAAQIQTISTGDFTAFGVGVVPEPASVAIWSLLGLALAGLGVYRARWKK